MKQVDEYAYDKNGNMTKDLTQLYTLLYQALYIITACSKVYSCIYNILNINCAIFSLNTLTHSEFWQ